MVKKRKNLFFLKEKKINTEIEKKSMNATEIEELKKAKQLLENPALAMKLANHVGRPVELLLEKVDSKKLTKITEKALNKSLSIAISSLNTTKKKSVSNGKHKLMTVLSGGVGGAFGLPALAIELPISTTIMLRSIADIADSEGHDLNELETRMACLEVFSLGSNKSSTDDGAESAYFAARGAVAYEMKLAIDAVASMSEKALQEALAKGQLPMFVKVIETIASRFGISVSQKFMAETVPIVGAIGGASINLMFMNHFQNMAEGHFIVKRLEKKYGLEMVENEYDSLLLKFGSFCLRTLKK